MDICMDRVKTLDQDTPRHTAWKLRLRVAKQQLDKKRFNLKECGLHAGRWAAAAVRLCRNVIVCASGCA